MRTVHWKSSLTMARKGSLEQLEPFSRLKGKREGFTLVELSSKPLGSNPQSNRLTEDVWIETADVFEQIQTQQEPQQKETDTNTEWVESQEILDYGQGKENPETSQVKGTRKFIGKAVQD